MEQPRFLNLGDSALTLEFGDTIDRQLVARVAALDLCLNREMIAGYLTGVIEIVPTYRSLTVIFDPLVVRRAVLQERLQQLLDRTEADAELSARRWSLPICYGGEFGPDLEIVAETRGLTSQQVIELHLGQTYLVYMIGFLPGFPFMGDVAPALEMPRRTEPRVRVPSGSVAITGQQTAIYPWESPGGWQLLGRCPLRLFDAEREQPALLAPGDLVAFHAVDAKGFEEIFAEEQRGSLNHGRFLLEEACA